ncbi:MAG: arginine--tRNA ligase, partial [Thaumarchaeota archaeon]
RILEKADEKPSAEPYGELNESEKTLLRRMAYFPLLLEDFSSNMMVKPIASYSYKLASEFNAFYESSPVLRAEAHVKRFRLAVVKAFLTVFSVVLDLLGIPAPEAM